MTYYSNPEVIKKFNLLQNWSIITGYGGIGLILFALITLFVFNATLLWIILLTTGVVSLTAFFLIGDIIDNEILHL